MGTKSKIVALVIAILTALTPTAGMTCTHGPCTAKDHASSMPCHAKQVPNADGALDGAVDHSCCRILAGLPIGTGDRMSAQRAERNAFTPVSEGSWDQPVSHPLENFIPSSPPRCPTQSLSRVLLI